jgi:hypothetical protein
MTDSVRGNIDGLHSNAGPKRTRMLSALSTLYQPATPTRLRATPPRHAELVSLPVKPKAWSLAARRIRVVGLLAVAAALAAVVIAATALDPSGPGQVSAQTILSRAAIAMMPEPGQASYRLYRIHIQCTRVPGCSHAKAVYWDANTRGDYFSAVKAVQHAVVVARTYTWLHRTRDGASLSLDYYPPPSRHGIHLSRAGIVVTDLSSDLGFVGDPTLLRKALRDSSRQAHLVTVAGWSLSAHWNRLWEAWAGIATYGMKRFDGAMTYVVQVHDAPYLVYIDARTYVVRGVAGYSCGTFVSPCGPHHPRYAWRMKLVRERTLPLCAVPRSDRAQILHFKPHGRVCGGRA